MLDTTMLGVSLFVIILICAFVLLPEKPTPGWPLKFSKKAVSNVAHDEINLEERLDMALIAREWYRHSLDTEKPSIKDDFENMVGQTIKTATLFAIQEVIDGKVSKRPIQQLEKIELLLESAFMGLIEEGMSPDEAQSLLKDEISLMIYSFELKDMIPVEKTLHNPAEQYFELRDSNL